MSFYTFYYYLLIFVPCNYKLRFGEDIRIENSLDMDFGASL